MKMQPPTVVDMVLHQRYVPRSRYYFCSGHLHFNHEQQAPFILPLNNKLYAQSHNSQPRKLQQRRKSQHKITDNYHALQSSDILHRLHVEDEKTKGSEMSSKAVTAITDIDPQYFTELSDQVIGERFSLRQLITDTKEILKTKILIELKKDKCRRIDQLVSQESKILSQAEEDFLLFKSGFDNFLTENRDETVRVNLELEKETLKTRALEEKLARLAEQSKTIQREIYNLEQPWRQQKMCQQFLYKVSPESWRLEQDEQVELDDVKFIDQIEPVTETKPLSLYFREPSELIRIFNAIGMQKLNALTHLDLLSETIEQMEKIADKAQNEVDKEIQKIRKQIDKLEMAISLMVDHADNLQKYTTNNLEQVLNQLIKSGSTLALQAEIEEAYKKCVGPIDEQLSNLEMMKAIEQTCENLNVELDKFPKDIVSSCNNEYRRNKRRQLRADAEAKKEEKRMNRLMIILKRMMEPAKQPTRRIMWRSDPPAPKEEKVRPPMPLTEDEIMYLDLFTGCSKYDVDVSDRAFVPVELVRRMKERMAKSTKQEQKVESDYLF